MTLSPTLPIWIAGDQTRYRAWSEPVSAPENLPTPPTIREVIIDHYEFRAGDPVPSLLEHTEGVAQLTFAVNVTVYTDLQGGHWVVPETPCEFPIHVEGYGPHVPIKIHGQGRGGLRILNRAPIDVQAYLNLPQG